MKRLLSLIAVLFVAVTGMLGQSPAPGILNYQGVARNSVGNVLVNKSISLRLTIRDGSAAGPVVYQESRGVTTNPFGLFNVQLGSAGASSVTGTIAGVPWGVGLKYIQVEIDPNGGAAFINIGTAQLASVPYSLYATTANDLVLPFDKTQADAGTLFRITNSGTGSGSTALEGRTNSAAGSANAIIGTVTSVAPGGFSSGVRGINNGTGGNGIGVYGSQAGSGWGVYGTTPSGRGVYGESNTGIGVFGQSTSGTGGRFISTSGLALHTSGGGVRLQNINEGVNRILATIPGNGDATWQDPSAVGIVTGSGTLNYVPKWTPNGTNLGNSQIFDNGTSVGVGTATPAAANKLEVAGIQRINNTTLQEGGELRFQEGTLFGAPNHWIIDNFQSIAGGNKFRLWNDVGGMNIQMMPGGRTAIGNMVFSDQPQSTLDVEGNLAVGTAYSGTTAAPANGAIIEGNVGIGTNNPLGKLHVSSGSAFLAANLQGSSNVGTWLSLGNTDPGGRWFNLVNTATANGEGPGKLIVFQGGAANLVTGSIMTMVHSNMNVGINNNNPTAKLHVNQNDAAGEGLIVNSLNAANTANGANVIKINTASTGFGNGAIYAQRGNTAGTYYVIAGATGITSLAATPGGYGIQGTSDNGAGIAGLSTNGIGVRGFNLNAGNAARFENLINATNAAPVVAVNNISTVGGVYGVHSIIAPTAPGGFSTALRGQNNGTGGFGIGVWGSQDGSGWGVYGNTPAGLSVYGSTSSGIGVYGEADGGWGMRAVSNTNTAIFSTSNSGFGGDFRSQTNIAGLFQTQGAGNTVRGAIQTYNPSTSTVARAFYAQGSGFSGWSYNPGHVSEFQGNTTSGIVSISTNANSIVSASETGNAVYGQILTTNGTGNAAVLGASGNNNSHGLYGVTPAGGIGRALATDGPVQLTAINEATNRILASIDNFGNARWEDASAVGIVSGSGTLNYVPKWTPDGSTLGNSQIFDNGFNVGVGTAVPLLKLHVASNGPELYIQDVDDVSSISLIPAGLGYTGGVGTRGNFDLPLFTNNLDRVTIKAGTGDVGINTSTPFVKFHVNSGTNFNTSLLEARDANNAGPHQFFYSGGEFGIIDYIRTDYTVPADIHRRGALEVRGVTRLNLSPTNSTDMTTGMTIRSNGNVGIGTASPGYKVSVASTVAIIDLVDTDNLTEFGIAAPGTGYTGGVGTVSNHDLAIFSNNTDRITVKSDGKVGVNTFTPSARFQVVDVAEGIRSEVTFPAPAGRIGANVFSSLNSSYSVLARHNAGFSANNPFINSAITGVDSTALSTISAGVSGYSIGTIGSTGIGVYGMAGKDLTFNASPLWTTNYSGAQFWGADYGATGSVWDIGVVGLIGAGTTKIGLMGWVSYANPGGVNYGIYSNGASGGGTNYAGYFAGDVQVNGNFSATGAKAFRIDHPLDPANKYLNHFAVESPEVQNVYTGNIKTDAGGKAIVQLPDYFSAVNRDFKYQLTIVDETQFAMARVSRKISGNSFEVMTSVPNIEVSWQVTAVRDDKAAQKFAQPAEMDKPANERGKYLNPELYGQSDEKSVHKLSSGGLKPAVVNKESVPQPIDPKMMPPVIQPRKVPVDNAATSEQQINAKAAGDEIMKTWNNGGKVDPSVKSLPAAPPISAPKQTDQNTVVAPAKTPAAAAAPGMPLAKPVMTGQLQRSNAPASPATNDTKNIEREKLNKTQGEKPSPATVQPAETPVKLEKGSVKEGE